MAKAIDDPASSLFGEDLFGNPAEQAGLGPLRRRFIENPFSVLNAQGGAWLERKHAWLTNLRLKGEVGRDNVKTYNIGDGYELKDGTKLNYGKLNGLSVFDPVLCELIYRWFCPPGGRILDPFAGGPPRGVVAAFLGYEYVGVEIRSEQIAANQSNAAEIGVAPTWIEGNSSYLSDLLREQDADPPGYDLLFTCPPYYDLERYAGPDGDGSMLPDYPAFMDWYEDVFRQAATHLKPNGFAVVVVSEIRDKRGEYRGFVPDTIRALQRCGLSYYNHAILVTAIASLAVRMNFQFATNRKLGRTHQDVLIMYNGDPSRATKELPKLEDQIVFGH